VAALARQLGAEFVREKCDVLAESKRRGWNLEDGGRRLRREFFEAIVRGGRATQVALAHTADDQAETVLAQMIRGTGPTGLAGIYPVAGHLVRPLIEMRRAELREYLRGTGQAWREDSSNSDTARLRARIRERLIPVLTTEFSPAITEHLSRLSRLAREEGEFWDALVELRFRELVREQRGALTIESAKLLNPLEATATGTILRSGSNDIRFSPLRALTERLVRRLYKGIRGDLRELTAEHVEQVVRLASDGASGSRVELPGGITVEKVFGSVEFRAANGDQTARGASGTAANGVSYQYQVERPANGLTTVSVPELGTSFRLKVIDWSERERDTKRETVALDADLMEFPLILRNWRPGDAYRPKGRRDERKLKQLLLASRVPASNRAGWPVLESGGRIVWAMGMPPSADFLASQATRVGLVIEDAAFPDDRGI
jgi:tRNA(Ile)-lysidine synthase